MRAVIQRVMQASVTVGDELVSSIGRGLCVLVGISNNDTPKDMEYIVRKILNIRLFEDDQGKRWMKSAKDLNFEVLCVSQFTLYSVLKGNKPDFHLSMGAEKSEEFYNQFIEEMKKAYSPEKIKDGKFGAMMQVHIQNDGPVTIELESPVNQNDNSKGAKGQKTGKQSQPSKSNSGAQSNLCMGKEAVSVNELSDDMAKASAS